MRGIRCDACGAELSFETKDQAPMAVRMLTRLAQQLARKHAEQECPRGKRATG